MKSTKACSGKCLGGSGTCGSKMPRVWVVAACEGVISLLEKHPDGHVSLLPRDEATIFSSVEALKNTLMAAEGDHMLEQLVIIGSKGDIAWMHAALPEAVAGHIVAEIEYPLVAGWFKQPTQLVQALERVFSV